MTSYTLSEYLELGPRDRMLADCLYWKKLTDRNYRRFLVGLFRMALAPGESREDEHLLATKGESFTIH